MPKKCPRNAQDMPEICQRMTTRKTVLTKRLPDKTSKPVRLKKKVAQIGPDKTSKAGPDKMSS